MKRGLKKWSAACAVFAAVWFAPRWVCGRSADGFFDGDVSLQRELARGQQHWVDVQLSLADFQTGSRHFDGEWLFGTYMMSAVGFAQIALEHRELRAELLPSIERCIDLLLSEDVREFETRSWSEDPLHTLDGDSGHAAYLGYMNLALSLHRLLEPHSRFAALNDAISAALQRRVQASASGLIETFPGATFPIDNLAVIGSISVHARATQRPAPAFLPHWIARIRRSQIDPRTGLLIQAADALSGSARDRPRGSGTALGAFFASFTDPSLARDLHRALRQQLAWAPLGLGVVREYAPADPGAGDIDSGPIVLGLSASASGFSLGSARAAGDRDHFREVFRTADLFGGLRRRAELQTFVAGGPLGNAILLAMVSAGPAAAGEVVR